MSMRQSAMQYQIADRDDLLPEVRQHSEIWWQFEMSTNANGP
jgi:hypothetical protein